MKSLNKYIECAKIVNTHGCHGDVKLECWCNSPDDLVGLDRVYRKNGAVYDELKIKKASIFKQFVIVAFDGINDMDQAMEMKDVVLYADRDDFSLEEGEFFIADLIGLDVYDAVTKEKYGVVVDVINRGASDIYVLKTPKGEAMIPAVNEFIDRVSLEDGLFITPIEGMID